MENPEKRIKKDKPKPPTFILFLLIFILLVLYFIYEIGLDFKPIAIIEYEGYAVEGKKLVENLLRRDLNAEKYIEPIKIQEDSPIYKKVASYFVGEEKKVKINLDYPIYINKNMALLNMTDDIKLITTDFEKFEGYKDSTLTDGGLYNTSSLERADYNDYLLIKNSDNIYISSKEITIKTTMNTYIIPENSIINFTEEYITYYHIEDDVFKYETIIDVTNDSKVIFESLKNIYDFENGKVDSESFITEQIYKKFLIKLNIIKESNKIENEEIQEEEPKEDNEPDKDNSSEEIWQKPEVRADELIPNVYTASTKLSIYDPSGVINTSIVFEIYKEGKIYMRNQAISSGNLKLGVLEPDTEYEVIGRYQYVTSDKKIIEVQFMNQKIKTKDTSELKPLKLSFENPNIYPDKIELTNLKLDCDLKDVSETIVGLKRAEIIINNKSYNIKSSDLRKILVGQAINFQSSNNLKSNSKYKFEINFYDVSNNLGKVQNNSGETRTCMQRPEVILSKDNKKTATDVQIQLKYINPDNVIIKNQRYAIYAVSNELIDEGTVTSNIIKTNDLELGKYYIIRIYGDFDLNDNNGEKKGEILGETFFVTSELKDFGSIYIDLNTNTDKITTDSVDIDISINATTNKTKPQLIAMLNDVKVILQKDNEVFLERYLTEEEFYILKKLGTVNLSIDKLDSNATYEIKIESTVKLGNVKETFSAIINGNKRFNTLKEKAIINIKNLFILNNTIDFDINIYDKDGSIRDNNVILEVISTKNEAIQRNEIKVSKTHDEYTRIQIKNLSENQRYYLSLTATKYSIRHEESTLQKKSFEFNGDEKRIKNSKRNYENVGIISTNEIGGNILLQSIERSNIDKNGNLIDVESNVNWYSECFNTEKGYFKEYDSQTKILKLGVGESTSQYYLYNLLSSYTNYNKEELEVTFKFKKSNSNINIYLQNGVSSRVMQLDSQNTVIGENGWYIFDSKDIENTVIQTDKYIGLLLEGTPNSYIEIKEFQVKLKAQTTNQEDLEDNETSETDQGALDIEEDTYKDYEYNLYSSFLLNLNLYNKELETIGYEPNVTNGKYYIRLKNNTDNIINDIEYNDYADKAINDKGKDKNIIEEYISNLSLLGDKKYEIMLVLKNPNIPEREYILSTIEVDTTNKEIKNISNIDEYLEIQPNGSYIFSNNINLGTGDYKFGNENLQFNGFLDFNGKTISRKIELKQNSNYKYYLFYGLSENAIIKNLYFDFSIELKNQDGNTNIEINEKDAGLVYENKGIINNIIVNLKSCTASPIKKFAIIGYENKGTLENFVIYLRSNFYLGGDGALGFVYCTNGIIRNGYITPYPNTNYSIKPIECLGTTRIAGLSSYVTNNSTVNNIYSLVTINNEDQNANNSGTFYTGNLISQLLNSTVRNVYSVGIGNITLNNLNNGTAGPTIAQQYKAEEGNVVENSYFFYEGNANNNEHNVKVNIAALSNEEFQQNLLNSENQFIINSNIKNYFPKVKISGVMPNQLNIPMKKAQETDADILSVKALEESDTDKLVEITIYNPNEAKIDKIEIEGLELDKYRIHSDEHCKTNSLFEKCKGHDEFGYCIDQDGNRILVEEDGYTQSYLSGQTTKLIVKIRIPTEEIIDEKGFDSRQYKSKYYLKSIRAKGYEDKIYIEEDGTRKIANEIKLSYYYQISDINKWKRINQYPDENYRIISDLDFSNTIYSEYCITETFRGILNGKYTNESGKHIANLNNIGQEQAEIKLSLLYKAEGAKISDLMINGYTQLIDQKNITNDMYIGGLIGITTNGTTIENVHMNNVKIATKANKNNSDKFYIGGLISNASESIITNCSVSYKNDMNPNIFDLNENKLSSVVIGGLVGNATGITISNCFAKDLFINLKANSSNGIGGIAGVYSGKIKNCYSTGQIKTNISNIGGIFGNGESSCSCEDCYAMVNIKTEGSNIGGIGGIIDTDSIKSIKNSISLGNLYTSVVGNMNLNRIIGNVSTTTDNYAYKKQLINGFKSNFAKGAKYLYEKEQFINNQNKVFDNDIYNISDLGDGEGYLPRLKYKDSNELLPNQTNETRKKFPKNPTLEIISAQEDKYGRIEVKIKDENEQHVPTEEISIEIANFSTVNVEKRTYDEGLKIHTLYITGMPTYYLDSYEITKIIYKDNYNEQYSAEIGVKIDYIQYKEIKSIEDWAEEFCPEYSEYNYQKEENDGKPIFVPNQNYKIASDLNLSKIKNDLGLDIPVNLEIGRLIGSTEGITISLDENTELRFNHSNSGLFSNITRELKNLKFDNIKITNSATSYYTGVIANCSAQIIEDISFNNINITGSSYLAPIAKNTCTNVKNITLNNIKCTGVSYLSGFIGYSSRGTMTNIKAENIEINGTANYIGGLFGCVYSTTAYKSNMNNISVTNINIKTTGTGSSIGGVFGLISATTISNCKIKDINIECIGHGTNVGGLAGRLYGATTNVYIYGINIKTNGTYYIGGLGGEIQATVTNIHIEGYIKDGKNYNTIYAPNGIRVGGIGGYCSSGVVNVAVKNLEILGNTHVGGAIGWTVICSNGTKIISQDNIITGNNNVGGIVGSLLPHSSNTLTTTLKIYNSYTNSKVIANVENAGGIIGFLDNSKMNNKRHKSLIYNNYVACSEITAGQNAGGLIGKITNPIYYLNDTEKYYYGNLVVTNISEEYPIGNIDSLQETYKKIVTIIDEETNEEITTEIDVIRNVEPEVTKSRLFNSLFYQYENENKIDEDNKEIIIKVLEKSKLDKIKLKDTYVNTLSWKDNKMYNYASLEENKFPLIKGVTDESITFNDGKTHEFKQTGVLLPEEKSNQLLANQAATFSVNAYLKENLPKYEIYVSDVDKINIEFNEISTQKYFKYQTVLDGVSEKIPLNKRTYTFKYDFNSEFKIILGNGQQEIEEIINAEDIKKKVSIANGINYYLDGENLKSYSETLDGKFVNLFNSEALTTEGYIYNLIDNTKGNEKIEGLKLLSDSVPVAKYVYSNKIIETYYNYSTIISEDEKNIDYQIFMKNGNISILDGNLDIYADSIIIDSYNNKEYQTVLGKDGILYDLKEKLNYPENFENKNIFQMTNNINVDKNELVIMYTDGRVYVFNYITGSILFDSNNQESNKSFISNVMSLFKEDTTLYELNKGEYEEALSLQEKLTETPIEMAQEQLNEQIKVESNETEYNSNNINLDDKNVNNNTNQNTNNQSTDNVNSNNDSNCYTTVYDSKTNKYLVYKTSELINSDKDEKEEIISETEKINSIPALKKYYNTAQTSKYINKTNGIYFVLISITSIIAILGIMYKRKNY